MSGTIVFSRRFVGTVANGENETSGNGVTSHRSPLNGPCGICKSAHTTRRIEKVGLCCVLGGVEGPKDTGIRVSRKNGVAVSIVSILTNHLQFPRMPSVMGLNFPSERVCQLCNYEHFPKKCSGVDVTHFTDMYARVLSQCLMSKRLCSSVADSNSFRRMWYSENVGDQSSHHGQSRDCRSKLPGVDCNDSVITP